MVEIGVCLRVKVGERGGGVSDIVVILQDNKI